MCLYPRLIINKKYIPNKKNQGTPPELHDIRTKYVPVGCGRCMECLKQRQMQWQIRLQEEIRHDHTGNFITLSFSDESLNELDNEVQKINKETINKSGLNIKYKEITGYDLENEIATLAVRRFLERVRKDTGKSMKHWLVTELGHNNTERIHIHGIIFDNKAKIIKHWQYGNVWIGNYVNEATVNYIVKYISKADPVHKFYTPIVLTSKGIGNQYFKRSDALKNKFKDTETNETYKTRQGVKLGLPKYYRNKLYTDQEREKLWINLLNKETRYVNGIKIDVSKNEDDYNNVLEQARKLNKQLGFGKLETDWNKKQYELQKRNIKRLTRKMKNNLDNSKDL